MAFKDDFWEAMCETDITQVELSRATGISKSAISQYLKGKHEPSDERKELIADAMGLPSDYFMEEKVPDPLPDTVTNLPVEEAARIMGKSKEFVYQGLREGIFPWGYALKMGTHWSYYISSVRFRKEVCGED